MNKRSGLADSPFFTAPARHDPATAPPAFVATDPVPRVPPARDVRDVRDERPVLQAKRTLKRHPFDIYADQLERLRVVKAQALRRGEDASMSRMVREALEAFLAQHE
jgi:hypothetical protein